MTTKGILMAGGRGSRLGPLTGGSSKHLLPVHDKPMIFYPLSLMISMGIREVLLVADPVDVIAYRRLLGDGSCFGVTLDIIAQPDPGGLAEGILLAADFIDHQPVAMLLGDNLLHARRPSAPTSWTPPRRGAHILAMPVADPTRFGVVTLDATGRATDLVEKPSLPQSNLAVPGVYLYDGDVVEVTRTISPSPRGELEITDVNRAYLRRGDLHVTVLPKGTVWHDAGTVESLHDAAEWVRREQSWMHRWVGVPEEAAWRAGLLRAGQLRARGRALLPSAYGQHLIDLAADSAPATAPAQLTPAA